MMYVDEIHLVLLPYQGHLCGVLFIYWFYVITVIIVTSHTVQN
jgi:hypothetical protein